MKKYNINPKKQIKKEMSICIDYNVCGQIEIYIRWKGHFNRKLFDYTDEDEAMTLPPQFDKYGNLTLKIYRLRNGEDSSN